MTPPDLPTLPDSPAPPTSRGAPLTTPQEEASAPAYAWIILAVVFLLSMAAPLNQFKVPPVMPLLIDALQLSLSSAGLLMSVFAITGFFLAIPAGFILQRLGLKTTGLVSAAFLVGGSLLGVVSAGSGLLLFSRFIEGVGMGLVSVTAPAAIAAWFPPRNRGTPMGIWAGWVPAGSLLMYLVAPALADGGGWRAVWWFGLAFAAVAFVVYALFMRLPDEAHESGDPSPALSSAALGQALRNRQVWLLGAVFACFTYAMLAVGTYYPTFLVEQRGYTVAAASRVLSLNNVAVLFSAPASGWLSDRLGTRKRFFTVPFLILLIMVPLIYQITDPLITLSFFLMGTITSAIPATVFSATPEVMRDPRLVGMGMAVITMGQNLGMVAGPAVFGLVAEQVSWTAASLSLLPILILGFILGRLVRVA